MRAFFASARANARAADEVTPSAHAVSQVRTHERDRISVAPHRNTFEIMRLFATYHSAHSRFTLRDTTASTMTAWKGGNIQSHAAAQITSDRACGGANRWPTSGRIATARSSRSVTIVLPA